MKHKVLLSSIVLCLIFFFGINANTAWAVESEALTEKDTSPGVRTPITHGFWFPKMVAIGEEWYRGRLIQSDAGVETGELPTGVGDHRGFTAINNVRWNITHHWFGGDDVLANEQLYSRNPDWFFDAANPPNSVMGVFAMFRWGMINEIDARLTIHGMITNYTDREYVILGDGIWLFAMSKLSVTDFTVNDGPRTVPNPLGFSEADAIRNEIGVIIIHHFYGRNKDNTVEVMNKIYEPLVELLEDFNDASITEEVARKKISKLVIKGVGK